MTRRMSFRECLLRGLCLPLWAGAIFVMVIACTGCLRAGVVGDSITAWGAPEIHTAFDPSFDTTVDGTPSATIADKAADITAFAATNPDVFVLNIGNNDALQCSPTIVADWNAQMAKMPASTRKVGVTIYSQAGWSPCMNAEAAQLDANIRLGAYFGLWRIVDWDQTVCTYQATTMPYGPILADGLHPTTAGYTRLANDEEAAAS